MWCWGGGARGQGIEQHVRPMVREVAPCFGGGGGGGRPLEAAVALELSTSHPPINPLSASDGAGPAGRRWPSAGPPARAAAAWRRAPAGRCRSGITACSSHRRHGTHSGGPGSGRTAGGQGRQAQAAAQQEAQEECGGAASRRGCQQQRRRRRHRRRQRRSRSWPDLAAAGDDT